MSRLSERIENFKKAYNIFFDAVQAYNQDENSVLIQMALIQSFEICIELAWKVLKDYLQQKGINSLLPKDVIKEAFSTEIIKNGQVWIDMINARNSTPHEYNIDKVNVIIKNISSNYYEELQLFNKEIEKFNEK